MDYTKNITSFFVVVTFIVLSTISMLKIGTIDAHAIIATGAIVLPAVMVMGYLGRKIGKIMDNPNNRDDADYKIAVLNALKKMDKKMSLQELNEKLTKTIAEPDLPDTEEPEDDLDV